MFEKITKYFPLVTVLIFILDYAYLNGYYSTFHISITNYISTSEVFYVLLPFVALLLSSGLSFLQGYLTPGTKKSDSSTVVEVSKKKSWFRSWWFSSGIAVLALVGEFINRKHFTYRDAPLVQTVGLIIVILGFGFVPVRSQIIRSGLSPLLKVGAFLIIGYIFIQFGKDTARINKTLGNENTVIFKYHNKIYKTDDKLILLGETQTTLFVYFKSDTSTWVIPRSNLDSLVILDK